MPSLLAATWTRQTSSMSSGRTLRMCGSLTCASCFRRHLAHPPIDETPAMALGVRGSTHRSPFSRSRGLVRGRAGFEPATPPETAARRQRGRCERTALRILAVLAPGNADTPHHGEAGYTGGDVIE